MHFASWNTHLLIMLLMGIAFIGLLAVVYRQIAKAVRKRKSQKFEAELAGTGPAGRRQDLGDRFREGIQKLREAKVDVYSLPWYVVVGEAGSGKTEAIRNSRLQFPLNDHMQGTGGTADMHWWITDEAVLLDTAGRLFLHDEKDRLSQDQWSDFLKLLRHTRPHCPVTGLLLVVPADKLNQRLRRGLGPEGAGHGRAAPPGPGGPGRAVPRLRRHHQGRSGHRLPRILRLAGRHRPPSTR